MTSTPDLSFRYGVDALRGGLDITISLSPEEADVLGHEAADLCNWFDTALWALALLRTGLNTRRPDTPPTVAADWMGVISDLDTRLLPRLQGLRDAAIRAHQEQGGTLNALSLAMDSPKSTAQSRRNKILGAMPPGAWETWARDGGPTAERASCPACGHRETAADPLVLTTHGDAVHHSHVTDPESSYHGTAVPEEP